MTITPCLASVNAAQVPSPMNGGIAQPSTETLTSLRGNVTRYTPSFSSNFPLRPVSESIFGPSSAPDARRTNPPQSARIKTNVFIRDRLRFPEQRTPETATHL